MKQIIRTIFWSSLAAGLNFLISLIIVPFVTGKIGTEAYGFVSLANNFISYTSIFTLALNSYGTRFISVEYHKRNIKKAQEYYSSIVLANIVLGIFLLLISTLFVINLEKYLRIPETLIGDVKVLFMLVFINFIIMNIGNSFSTSAYIHDKLAISGVYKNIAYGIEIVLFIYFFGALIPSLWYVGIAYIAYSMVICISNYYIYKKFTIDIRISVNQFSYSSIKKLVVSGICNSLNSLGNTLNSGLDLLITNMMLDTVTMGELAIAKTIGTMSISIYQMISHAFQPLLLKTYAKNEKEKLLDRLFLAMKISGFFMGVFFVFFVTQGKAFYKIWIPTQNIERIYILTIITLLSSVLEGIMGPLYYIYTLAVKNKIPCIVTVCGGILNVGVMYILLKETYLGVYAVVGTTAVIMLFINFVTNPIYMAKCLNIKWTIFYPVIMKYILSIIVSLVFCSGVVRMFVVEHWGDLFLILGIETLLFVCIYIFMMFNKNERDVMLQRIAMLK